MAVLLSPVGGVAAQFFTNAGVPLSGGKIYTYAAGTSTPQATYTTGAGNIQHSNPIVLDAAGRVPTGEIWLTDGLSYKFVLKDANDVLIATYDNIVGINSNFVNFVNQQEIQTATAGQTVFTLTTMEYQPGTGNLSVFVDGVNQYGPGAQYAYTETSSTVVTFVSGLHVGASVKFTTTEIQNSGVADASQITYTYPAAGAVSESVETRLSQKVYVRDFGAVGDGVTDDTAAIQAAIDALQGSGVIDFGTEGIYVVSDTISYTSPQGLWLTSSGYAYAAGSQPKVQIKWTGNSTDPIFKFIDASFRVTVENLGFSAAPIAIKFTRVVADSLCHNNYIKHCVFDGQTIASIVWGYELTESYPSGNDNFDGLTITECYFGNSAIGILANPKNNSYHLRTEKCDFGSNMDRPIVVKNVSDISFRDTNPLVSDYANGYYAIDIDSGDRWLSLDNIYTETPLLLKTTNWGPDSANTAYLKNVVINSSDTDTTRTAIYIDQYAILDNVQATTNATPMLSREMEFNNGYFAVPYYRNADNVYVDNATKGSGISKAGQIYEAGRSAYIGGWTSVTYSAGNFTASNSQTWTVDSGDQITYKYMLIGKTMWLQFWIQTSSVSGSCDELRLAIPGGYTPYGNSIEYIRLFNVTDKSGIAIVQNGATYIRMSDSSGAVIAASTNTTSVQGTVCFEIL